MTIAIVVGTRPEIIKVAPVIKELEKGGQNSYLFTQVSTMIMR